MLHYLRWMMGQKPYLVLEIDSHTADAGLDTRIEAFLDIVDSYRRHAPPAPAAPGRAALSRRRLERARPQVVDTRSRERFSLRDPRVTLVWPSLGDLAGPAVAAATRRQGVARGAPAGSDRPLDAARPERGVGQGVHPGAARARAASSSSWSGRPLRRPDEALVVLVPSTLGPCRTGQYHVFYDKLFDDLGLDNVALLVSGDESSYGELGPRFMRDLWRAILLSDYFTDVRTGIRLLARDVDDGLAVFERTWNDVLAALAASPRALGGRPRARPGGARRDPAAPLAGRRQEGPGRGRDLRAPRRLLRVRAVGAPRRRRASSRSWPPSASGCTTRTGRGPTRWMPTRRRDGWLAALRSGGLAERAWLGVESWWKHRVEHELRAALMPTGLVPETPHDLDAALEFGGRTFVSPEMQSEATVSPAVAAAAMQDGYSGVAIIAPFGCLPGRLIEGVYAPWARAHGYPVVALENDGQPYPPNVIARLEVFAQNVERYERPRPPFGRPALRR